MRRIRLILLSAVLFLALFVVIPGVGRLFEAEEAPVAGSTECVRMASAILTGVTTGTEDVRADRESPLWREQMPAGLVKEAGTPAFIRARRDANGNIVTARAYYRSVPEAFAPGDAKT